LNQNVPILAAAAVAAAVAGCRAGASTRLLLLPCLFYILLSILLLLRLIFVFFLRCDATHFQNPWGEYREEALRRHYENDEC